MKICINAKKIAPLHSQVSHASVVQWIEWQIPVLLIWVRFPSGVLAKYFERLCSATFCGYEVIPGVETGSDSFGEFPNHYHTISPVVRRSTVVGQTSATSRFLSKVMPGCILIVRIVGNKAYTNGLIV